MVRDKRWRKVKEGDVIMFGTSPKRYTVLSRNGVLGAYEDEEFFALKDVLRNFVVVNNERG